VSLTARLLEESGIPTVIVGSAQDIVESCAVPRFLFTDFPLGNPIGRPYDRQMQETVVQSGLSLLETALRPQTTVVSPLMWGEDQSWRAGYMQVLEGDLEKLRAMGESRRRSRSEVKSQAT
jgi:hypothetical protein